jgi:hypothetical protein
MRHIRETKPETEPDLQALDKQMTTTATLVVNLILDLAKQVRQNRLKELDCNAADAGCQMRATVIPGLLSSSAVIEELTRLETVAKEISAVLQIRRSLKCSYIQLLLENPTAGFFEKHILQRLHFSKEVCYLLDCRMLKVTRVVDHIEPNGIVVTKTSVEELSKLSKNIQVLSIDFRNQLVQNAAARISEVSLSFMRGIATRLNMPPLVQRMIQQVRQNKTNGNFVPKSFGCLFYEIQIMLTHLRQQQALIAIKSIVKEGKACHFFLRPQSPGTEFSFVDEKEVQLLPPSNILVVFEGVISLSNDAFAHRVQEVGFSRLILTCAAQEAPFEPGSRLEDIEDLEARAEIEMHKKTAPDIGCVKGQNPLLLLDHVFCNSLQDELSIKGKPC